MKRLAQAPSTRAECVDGPRPCPWAGCRYHMAFDVTSSGSLSGLKGTWPLSGFGVDAMVEAESDALVEWLDDNASCALDLADEGEQTLKQIGERWGVSRERIRQIEAGAISRALRKLPASLRDQLRESIGSRRDAHHLSWVDELCDAGLDMGDIKALRSRIREWEQAREFGVAAGGVGSCTTGDAPGSKPASQGTGTGQFERVEEQSPRPGQQHAVDQGDRSVQPRPSLANGDDANEEAHGA